jgi:F-type H+-transporting ATPase subunit alpha
MVELLKQGRFAPLRVENQVVAIFAGTKGFLDDMAVEDVQPFRDGLVDYVHSSAPDVVAAIVAEGKISDETDEALKTAITAYKGIFVAERSDDAPVVTASSESGE